MLYNASRSTTLTVTESDREDRNLGELYRQRAAAPKIAFINCTLPSAANTTCTGPPFSTGNNGTLQANVALKDTYGNLAWRRRPFRSRSTSASTTDYTVAPSPVTIGVGGSQSNQLTVTPAKNNAALTTITAHATSGGFADVTIQVKK